MAVSPEAQRAPAATAEQLFQEHSGWIYGYCLRILRSPEEAEDALQTTYLNACRSLNQGTRPRAGSAWLLRIAQNVCFARLRSSGRRRKVEGVQDMAILEETVAAPDRPHDALIGLTDALISMPEQQRKAILLREWKGLSHREVAAELGLTQAAVETLIFRARRSLAAALEQPEKRSRLRSLHVLDLGGLLAGIKGFFAGSAGVKAAVAITVAATTTATVVATDPAQVWRDRQAPSTSAPDVRESRSAPGPRLAATSPIVAPGESALGLEARSSGPRERGRAFGQAKATAAKEKTTGKGQANGNGQANGQANGNGAANGNGNAFGHAEKADSAPKASNGRGTPGGGRPDSAGEPGPPPHAPAKGHGQGKPPKPPKSK